VSHRPGSTSDRGPSRCALGAALVVAAGAAACGDGSAGAHRAGETQASPFLGDGRLGDLQLEEELERDLTGDGAPERIVVQVSGDDPRALEIQLTVFGRAAAPILESAWSSADYPEFRRAGSAEISVWVSSQVVRDRLEELLSDDSIRPFVAAEGDPAALRRELAVEAWRHERGLPASIPLTPAEEADAAAVAVRPEEVRALALSLEGRPAVTYLAGHELRTLVWSEDLGRFVRVDGCC
jgi:hypothetical protein